MRIDQGSDVMLVNASYQSEHFLVLAGPKQSQRTQGATRRTGKPRSANRCCYRKFGSTLRRLPDVTGTVARAIYVLKTNYFV